MIPSQHELLYLLTLVETPHCQYVLTKSLLGGYHISIQMEHGPMEIALFVN